jgi:rubrerythrin
MASLDDAIKLALAWEREARDNYLFWAGKTTSVNAKQLFLNLSKMESKHIVALEGINLNGEYNVDLSTDVWLDLSKDITSFPTVGDRDLKRIFDFAVSKEETASARYANLAKNTTDANLSRLFSKLAKEEAYHKLLITEQRLKLLKPY